MSRNPEANFSVFCSQRQKCRFNNTMRRGLWSAVTMKRDNYYLKMNVFSIIFPNHRPSESAKYFITNYLLSIGGCCKDK